MNSLEGESFIINLANEGTLLEHIRPVSFVHDLKSSLTARTFVSFGFYQTSFKNNYFVLGARNNLLMSSCLNIVLPNVIVKL